MDANGATDELNVGLNKIRRYIWNIRSNNVYLGITKIKNQNAAGQQNLFIWSAEFQASRIIPDSSGISVHVGVCRSMWSVFTILSIETLAINRSFQHEICSFILVDFFSLFSIAFSTFYILPLPFVHNCNENHSFWSVSQNVVVYFCGAYCVRE